MKKILLFLSLTVFAAGFSQEKEVAVVNEEVPNFKKNELKGNALFLLIGAVEITYERILREDSGAGLTFFVAYDEDNFNMNYSISPYYRFYFGKKPAAGFFVEGFAMYNQFDDYCNDCDYVYGGYDEDGYYIPYYGGAKEISNNFALGIGVGAKWVIKNGFLLELSGGIGRNLYRSNDYAPDFVGKGGIILGYRF